jgi:outer membrane receptor protein involved in Fe transport
MKRARQVPKERCVKLKTLTHMIALIGAAGPAFAQQAPSPQPMQRVEITGSSIRRINLEGALPVQTITLDQLDKQGITNAEQLMTLISANGTGADNMTSGNNVFGADADRVSGGGSFASLRGLGPSGTLVLINGRRIAGYGLSGKAVDLNTIPLAAIARVEVLKDGASAIYGTDAVGGVINFILKTDFEGLQATASGNFTEAGGGATRRLQLVGGKGKLDTDRYNLMFALGHDKNDRLDSRQRSFANGYQPQRGLSPDTTGTPVANQLTEAKPTVAAGQPLPPPKTALGYDFQLPGDPNRYLQAGLLSLQGKCDSVDGMQQYASNLWAKTTSPLRSTYSCSYDYGGDYVMQLPTERTNFVARGTFQLTPDHRLYAETVGAHTTSLAILTPAQISTTLAAGNAYPAGGPYYQNLQAYIPTFDPTKPILYKWRAWPLGDRTQQYSTDTARLLLGAEGTLAGKWDYRLDLSHSFSRTTTDLLDGYANTRALYSVLGSGIVNPWAAPAQGQSDAAMQALEATKFYGRLQQGKTTLTQLNGAVSGELFQLPGGAVSGALGTDLRRESYAFHQDVDATQILLAPGNANQDRVVRNIKAVYAELVVPVIKDLELQLALRRDDYSLIGATTNPKIAFSYRPLSWVMLRGSANKGFLAPSFGQLYGPPGRPALLCDRAPRLLQRRQSEPASGNLEAGHAGHHPRAEREFLGIGRLLGDQRQGPHPEPHPASGAGECRGPAGIHPPQRRRHHRLHRRRLDQCGRPQDARRRRRLARARQPAGRFPLECGPGRHLDPELPVRRVRGPALRRIRRQFLHPRSVPALEAQRHLQREQGSVERPAEQSVPRRLQGPIAGCGQERAAARLQAARGQLHHLRPVDHLHRLQGHVDHGRHPEPVRPRPAVHRAQRGRSRGRRLGPARGRSARAGAEFQRALYVLLIVRAIYYAVPAIHTVVPAIHTVVPAIHTVVPAKAGTQVLLASTICLQLGSPPPRGRR